MLVELGDEVRDLILAYCVEEIVEDLEFLAGHRFSITQRVSV